MRKEYGVALRDLFTVLLSRACPLFECVKKPRILAGFPGEHTYRWPVTANQHAWVVLVPDQKREAFTIELGWSRKGRFPQLTMRPSFAHPKDAGPEDEYLMPLGGTGARNRLVVDDGGASVVRHARPNNGLHRSANETDCS